MTIRDGYKHRHKWVYWGWLYGVEVRVCIKCENGEE